MARPKYIEQSKYDVKWTVSMGKGDADVVGHFTRASDGQYIGNVTIVVSKFSIERLGYNSDGIVRKAARVFHTELNNGKHKDIRNALGA